MSGSPLEAEVAEDLATVDTDRLPGQVRELVRLIGLAETLRLLQARGGIPTYVPYDPARAQVLCAILARHSVDALCRAMGGQTIETPMPDRVLLQLRNRAIIEDRRRGHSHARLAREHRLSRRQIINILQQQETDAQTEDPTPDLFGGH